MRRKSINIFSLSFIDCITCGLGAIILLFVIVNTRSAIRRNEVTKDLRGQTERLKMEVLAGKKNLVVARNTLEQTLDELAKTDGLARELIKKREESETERASYDHDSLAGRQHVNRLKADLKSMEEDVKRLKAGSASRDDHGSKVRHFAGHGDRQYLTDLKMGGRRIFILIDASASMLDDTIVGIIRQRNLSDQRKMKADKWRQAVASFDWLTTQLPPSARFQVYTFSETAKPLVDGSRGKWLDAARLNSAVRHLRKVVPAGGTSLVNAFNEIHKMKPAPDNIFLLTDSLPTMGPEKTWRKNVSGKKRLEFFNDAVRVLPPHVPLNVILYPMEGDPAAAGLFWKLAMATEGSFFCPARDWP